MHVAKGEGRKEGEGASSIGPSVHEEEHYLGSDQGKVPAHGGEGTIERASRCGLRHRHRMLGMMKLQVLASVFL